MRTIGAAMLSCLIGAGPVLADHQPPRAGRAAWAIGLPNGYVILEHQVRSIEITPADIVSGKVEVRAGSRLAFVARTPGGAVVDFHFRCDWPLEVRILGLASPIVLPGHGGTTQQLATVPGRHVVTLDYQFQLAPEMAPGTYAWPLQITVRKP